MNISLLAHQQCEVQARSLCVTSRPLNEYDCDN